MKWLMGLSVLQLIAILMLVALAIQGLPHKAQQFVSADAIKERSSLMANNPDTADYRRSGPSAEEIRQIVRQEIGLAVQRDDPPLVIEKDRPQVAVRNHQGHADLRNELETALAYFESVGEINAGEMAKLEAGLARLPADERKALLRRLARAISSGTIENRF